MGLFDWLLGGSKCPLCGTRGAQKSDVSDVRVRCPNPTCQYFDPSVGRSARPRAGGTRVPRRGNFVPEHPIEIRYRNFQHIERTFSAEKNSLVPRRNHILASVAPTGERITLSRDRILNLSSVEAALPELVPPTEPQARGKDLQVLSYHRKHGSTSALHEKVRAKYPNWRG